MNLILIKNLLKNIFPKAHIKEANNGREAIDLVKSCVPDLILMDVQMPVMDGITATKEIKSMDGGKFENIPIIALTAGVSNKEKEECFEAGMCEFIPKPIERSHLNKVLLSIFPLQQPKDTTEVMMVETEHFKKEKFIEKLGTNGDFYFSILETALQEFPKYINELKNAIFENDIQNITRAAHAIKGSAYNIEFNILGKLAQDIENQSNDKHSCSSIFEDLQKEWITIQQLIEQNKTL